MDSRRWTLPVLIPVLGWMACSMFGVPLLTPTASGLVGPTAATPNVPALTVQQVLNAEYMFFNRDGGPDVYRFTDGMYQQGNDPAAADFVSIRLVAVQPTQQVLLGDLNQDGAGDAAVLIAENYGGTGVFVSAAVVLNQDGQPYHLGSYSYLIDDRPTINSFRLQNGELFLDAIVHGPNDPGCCPAMPVTRTFRLIGNQLILVGATSKTPAGDERVIAIDSPLSGAEVSGALQLKGTVSISPFENTLSYSFYGRDGSELTRGPIMVSAPDLGAPGTFDVALDLAGLAPGPVILIVADFSAADGAVLALDSVELVIR